jgi:hypothetical protein
VKVMSRIEVLRAAMAAVAAATAVAVAGCGGGGGDGGNDGAAAPAAPPAPAPGSSTELPYAVDPARRLEVKRVLLPLLAGTYADGCLATDSSGQLVEGGGPLVVDAAGSRASAASASLDLTAPDSSGFQMARFFGESRGRVTASATITYGSRPNDTTFSIGAFNDEEQGPGALASLGGADGALLTAACGGAAPPLVSADLFGTFRGFIADRSVRMRECLSVTEGVPDGGIVAGEVNISVRGVTVNGIEADFDAAGKLAEIVSIQESGSAPLIQFVAQFPQRDVSISLDDAGNVREAFISDTGVPTRAISCKAPLR